MKVSHIYPLIATLLLFASIAGVSAKTYGPSVIIQPTLCNPSTLHYICPPDPAGGGVESGGLTIMYPNGYPVTVPQTQMALRVCGTAGGCVLVQAPLTMTAPGTYSYSLTLPSTISGTVQVIIPAGSLTDSYGTAIPNADVIIGTLSITA